MEHYQEGPYNRHFLERGLQHWNRWFLTTPNLLECVATNRGEYEKMKKRILNLEGFGKNWKLYPLFQPREDFIYFCWFQYMLNLEKC